LTLIFQKLKRYRLPSIEILRFLKPLEKKYFISHGNGSVMNLKLPLRNKSIFLTEPMVLTRDTEKTINCLSNVCTHRGNLVVKETSKIKKLICGYHGRRFGLNGNFEHMPEFKEAADFPRPCDDLHQFPLQKWGPLLFAGLNPDFDFQRVIDAMKERTGFLPIKDFKLDKSRGKDYFVDTHWALYCDNYLEGFHIPFVHEDLDAVLLLLGIPKYDV